MSFRKRRHTTAVRWRAHIHWHRVQTHQVRLPPQRAHHVADGTHQLRILHLRSLRTQLQRRAHNLWESANKAHISPQRWCHERHALSLCWPGYSCYYLALQQTRRTARDSAQKKSIHARIWAVPVAVHLHESPCGVAPTRGKCVEVLQNQTRWHDNLKLAHWCALKTILLPYFSSVQLYCNLYHDSTRPFNRYVAFSLWLHSSLAEPCWDGVGCSSLVRQ